MSRSMPSPSRAKDLLTFSTQAASLRAMREVLPEAVSTSPEVAFAIVFAFLHCCVHGKAVLREVRHRVFEYCAVGSKRETVFDAHKDRVDKAVEHQIEKNFRMASSLTPHCVPFIVPLLLTRQDTKVFLLQAFLAYVVQSCQTLKLITMSARRVRLFAQLFYLNWMLYGWERRFSDGPEASMMLSAMTFCRIMLVVIEIDSRLHIPGQTGITASLVLSKLHACGCTASVACLALSEGFTLVPGTGLAAFECSYKCVASTLFLQP